MHNGDKKLYRLLLQLVSVHAYMHVQVTWLHMTIDRVYFPTGLETEVINWSDVFYTNSLYYIIHKKIPSVSWVRMSVTTGKKWMKLMATIGLISVLLDGKLFKYVAVQMTIDAHFCGKFICNPVALWAVVFFCWFSSKSYQKIVTLFAICTQVLWKWCIEVSIHATILHILVISQFTLVHVILWYTSETCTQILHAIGY